MPINPMDIYAFAKQGADEGRARGTQSRLAQLAGQAYSDPSQRQSALAQMVATDPGAGMAFGKAMQGEEESIHEQIIKRAAMVSRAYKTNPQMAQAMYQGLPELAQRGGFGQVPGQLDDKVAMALEQMVASASSPTEGYTLSPGSRRFDGSNQMVAEAPVAPANASMVSVPDGQGGMIQMMFDPKTRQLMQPQYPGQESAQPAPQGGADVMGGAMRDSGNLADSISSLVTPLGGRITSTTGGQHNPGSKHYSGNAVDVGMGRESPEQQAQILAALQANPALRVRDERTRPPGQKVWSGPHLHVEQGQQVAQAGRMGHTPAKSAAGKAAPSGYKWNADGSMAPIPGGPAETAIAARADAAAARKAAEDVKSGQKTQAAQARQVEADNASNQLISAIDNLMGSEGFGSLGTTMGDLQINTPLIRNSAKDADAQLKNVAGQVALTTMSRLKALSASGATGFGSLTKPELTLLENSIATLQSENISNAQLKTSLKAIRDTMAKTQKWQPSGPKQPVTGGDFSHLWGGQ